MTIVRNLAILYLLLYSLWSFGQTETAPVHWSDKYSKELLEIQSLEQKGQNRSAYLMAEELYEKALSSSNVPGIIGSINLLIRNSYRVDDDALKTVLIKVGSMRSDQPVVASVMDSYIAELLTQYYERYRYRISPVQEQTSLSWNEIERWSATQFENAIDSLYKTSVNAKELKESASENIKFLLDQNLTDTHYELRPRIFDLLQERLTKYLRNNRLHWSIKKKIADEETVDLLTSLNLKSFLESQDGNNQLYAVIEAFHNWEVSLMNTQYKEAYIEVILQRILYVSDFLNEKNIPASISLLQKLVNQNRYVRNRLAIDHAIALLRYRQGDYVAALHTLQSALDQTPENAYPNNIDHIHQLVRTIKAPELYVQAEEAYPHGQRPLTSIQFRNLDKVRLELYPLTEKEFISWRFANSGKEDDFQLAITHHSIWEKTVELPSSLDYKNHRTEALINRRLNKGAYALRYWYRKDTLNLSGIVLFQITDLTLISAEQPKSPKFYILDRNTGALKKDARVEAITLDRSLNFRNSEVRLLNEQGTGTFIPPNKSLNQYYKVSQGNDHYISPLTYNSFVNHSQDQPFRRTVFLTDRSVYKPGQTIHFKALAVLSQNLVSQILKNQKIEISLRDANGKEVWHKSYQTDEWGTVTGTVPIPVSGLKGNWSLQASPLGQTPIQIESYQRPNFEITLPDSSIHRQDNKVTVNGETKTYHGFPVQNGNGKITVELQRRYWFYSANSENAEIIHSGTFKTDKNGSFNLDFQSIDPPVSQSRFGSFYFYSIHISVQANSGEIRELTKTVPLDPDQVQVQINYPSFQTLDDPVPMRFSVHNALQLPDSQQVKITISHLNAPETYIVSRHWDLPDQPLLTSSQFQKHVKNHFYDHRADMDQWTEDQKIKSWSQTIKDKDSLDLKEDIHHEGYYRILITSPEEDTLLVTSFGLADAGKDFSIVHDAVELLPDVEQAQPGETVRVSVFTPKNLKGGKLIVSRPDGTFKEYELDEEEELSIKINENDRGGIYVRAFGYLTNRFFEKSLFIEVPWTNKELDISGFEDISKIEVNTDTTLIINVKDYKKEGVSSEVALVIYDASLDAYLPHDWTMDQPFFRNFYSSLNVREISTPLGSNVHSENTYWEKPISIHPLKIPEFPDLETGFRRMMYARSKVTGMNPAVPEAMESVSDMAGAQNLVQEESLQQSDNLVSQTVQVRKDFAETIIFTGKARTDSNGQVLIPFHTNDKAGRWKILVFAHRKDLSSGVMSHTFETYQDLLLESYLPGMVRQGDEIDLAFTLYNNAKKPVSGQVQFEMKPLLSDANHQPYLKNLGFELNAGESTILRLPVTIEMDENQPLVFLARVVDDNGKIWDATEEVVPVYPSIETVYDGEVALLKEGEKWPATLAGDLLGEDKTNVTIRIVQNMYSELLKSIPYLQYSNPVTTDQFFKNGVQALLGQYITGKIPDFEKIYLEWKRRGELDSRLALNQDSKYVSLDYTPWMRQGDLGKEQMALLGLYFDDSHINQVVETNIAKWLNSQNADGGFPWIKDGPSSFYITIRFLMEWDKMKWAGLSSDYLSIDNYQRAQVYLDSEFLRLWNKMKKESSDSTINYQRFITYFSQRSFDFNTDEQSEEYLNIWNELKDSIYTNWSDYNFGLRADIGISAWHLGDKRLSRAVVESFIDNAIHDTELGVYWRYNHVAQQSGYLGILADIMELFIINDEAGLNAGITQWILLNKMTNDWQQNPYVNSLLLSLLKMGGEWTAFSRAVIQHNGEERILTGIGDNDEITMDAGELNTFHITNLQGPPIWVGMMTGKEVQPEDEITQSGGILHIQKLVTGSVVPYSVEIGDQLTIRLKISTDRDLDYVYIQDPLIPGMDPGISLSGFQWQYGLSYYQSFDPSTAQFYIQHLPKGEFILEYKLGVVRSGRFRNPRTKIQSYFVPEINGYYQWKPQIIIPEK